VTGMVFAKDDIKHLGWLSRIELTDKELEKFTSQIEEIIGYMNKLDTIPLFEIDEDQIGLQKKFSELRRDFANPFNCDTLNSSNNRKKEGFVKGPRMV
jgi:aspartyl-tRNA(Asn)/glutamyl-tRNA(Gln) amidotransferase subunit C